MMSRRLVTPTPQRRQSALHRDLHNLLILGLLVSAFMLWTSLPAALPTPPSREVARAKSSSSSSSSPLPSRLSFRGHGDPDGLPLPSAAAEDAPVAAVEHKVKMWITSWGVYTAEDGRRYKMRSASKNVSELMRRGTTTTTATITRTETSVPIAEQQQHQSSPRIHEPATALRGSSTPEKHAADIEILPPKAETVVSLQEIAPDKNSEPDALSNKEVKNSEPVQEPVLVKISEPEIAVPADQSSKEIAPVENFAPILPFQEAVPAPLRIKEKPSEPQSPKEIAPVKTQNPLVNDGSPIGNPLSIIKEDPDPPEENDEAGFVQRPDPPPDW